MAPIAKMTMCSATMSSRDSRQSILPRDMTTKPDTAGYRAASARRFPFPLTPYLEVRAVARNPQNLPRDVLFRDYIRGRGSQEFGIKAPAGEYQVFLLHPDRAVEEQKVRADNGRLTIIFPAVEWSVSGKGRPGEGTRGSSRGMAREEE